MTSLDAVLETACCRIVSYMAICTIVIFQSKCMSCTVWAMYNAGLQRHTHHGAYALRRPGVLVHGTGALLQIFCASYAPLK